MSMDTAMTMVMSATETILAAATGTMSMDHSGMDHSGMDHGDMDHGSMGSGSSANSSAAASSGSGGGGHGGHGGMSHTPGTCRISVCFFILLYYTTISIYKEKREIWRERWCKC